MYSVVVISDRLITLKLSERFLSHFNPEISVKVVDNDVDLVKVVRSDPVLDAILIEETEGIRFGNVLSSLTRSNITLPLILFSETCTPQLARDAINNHVNNYLCTGGREPADYYQELSNLVVFTIERDRILTQHSLDAKRLAALVDLAKLGPYNFPTMLDATLEKALELTDSDIGYVAIVDRDHNVLNMIAWSKKAQFSSENLGQTMTLDIDKAGLCGAPVKTGKSVIIDDYKTAKHPMKHGLPEGHVDLKRLMIVPIKYENEIIAVVGVANKLREYSASDEYNVESLFEELFKIQQSTISKNRYEADIEVLGHVLDSCPIGVLFLTEDYKKAVYNRMASRLLGLDPNNRKADIASLEGRLIEQIREMIHDLGENPNREMMLEVNDVNYSISISRVKGSLLNGYSVVIVDVSDVLDHQAKINQSIMGNELIQNVVVRSLKGINAELSNSMAIQHDGELKESVSKLDSLVDSLDRFSSFKYTEDRWLSLENIVRSGLSSIKSDGLSENIVLPGIQIFNTDAFSQVFYELKKISCREDSQVTSIDIKFSIEGGNLIIHYHDNSSQKTGHDLDDYAAICFDSFGSILARKICDGCGIDISWQPCNDGMLVNLMIPPNKYRIGS